MDLTNKYTKELADGKPEIIALNAQARDNTLPAEERKAAKVRYMKLMRQRALTREKRALAQKEMEDADMYEERRADWEGAGQDLLESESTTKKKEFERSVKKYGLYGDWFMLAQANGYKGGLVDFVEENSPGGTKSTKLKDPEADGMLNTAKEYSVSAYAALRNIATVLDNRDVGKLQEAEKTMVRRLAGEYETYNEIAVSAAAKLAVADKKAHAKFQKGEAKLTQQMVSLLAESGVVVENQAETLFSKADMNTQRNMMKSNYENVL